MSQELDRKSRLQVYDPAMCCSTGVCGPEINPQLVRFAADLKWLQEHGVQVERFNLSQSPVAFVENEEVKRALTEQGETALPMIFANNRVASTGRYPDRRELATWAGLKTTVKSTLQPTACRNDAGERPESKRYG